jgi:hypothetical protein
MVSVVGLVSFFLRVGFNYPEDYESDKVRFRITILGFIL